MINLSRSFSFEGYIFVVPGYCRCLYFLQAASQVSSLILSTDKGRTYASVTQSPSCGEMWRTISSRGWADLMSEEISICTPRIRAVQLLSAQSC